MSKVRMGVCTETCLNSEISFFQIDGYTKSAQSTQLFLQSYR